MRPPTTPTPEAWRRHVLDGTGRAAPTTMTDGGDPKPRPWSAGYDPADRVDQAILATRRSVFALHGLDQWA